MACRSCYFLLMYIDKQFYGGFVGPQKRVTKPTDLLFMIMSNDQYYSVVITNHAPVHLQLPIQFAQRSA